MTAHKAYRITVEPAPRPVQAVRGGVLLADGAEALVMHETGLPSYHYFPRGAVTDGVLQPSERRTFCPFKGTASYWHLDLPDGRVENGAFSYETPFGTAREIAGHIAFLDDALDRPLCLDTNRMEGAVLDNAD